MDEITLNPYLAFFGLAAVTAVMVPAMVWIGDKLFPPPRR